MRARLPGPMILLSVLLTVSLTATAVLGQRPWSRANYSRILDGLYMGGAVDAPPRGTTAVLNLTSQRNPYRCKVQVWEPIKDGAPAPSLAWLRDAVDWVDTQRRANRTTYVHCQVGMSRSALVVTAYLMREYGWSRDRALAYVREKRPMARPNPAFMKLLSAWERELRPEKKERPRWQRSWRERR